MNTIKIKLFFILCGLVVLAIVIFPINVPVAEDRYKPADTSGSKKLQPQKPLQHTEKRDTHNKDSERTASGNQDRQSVEEWIEKTTKERIRDLGICERICGLLCQSQKPLKDMENVYANADQSLDCFVKCLEESKRVIGHLEMLGNKVFYLRGSVKAIEAIKSYTKSDNTMIRRAAYRALLNCGAPRSNEALLALSIETEDTLLKKDLLLYSSYFSRYEDLTQIVGDIRRFAQGARKTELLKVAEQSLSVIEKKISYFEAKSYQERISVLLDVLSLKNETWHIHVWAVDEINKNKYYGMAPQMRLLLDSPNNFTQGLKKSLLKIIKNSGGQISQEEEKEYLLNGRLKEEYIDW